jgi:hypothetical protein
MKLQSNNLLENLIPEEIKSLLVITKETVDNNFKKSRKRNFTVAEFDQIQKRKRNFSVKRFSIA